MSDAAPAPDAWPSSAPSPTPWTDELIVLPAGPAADTEGIVPARSVLPEQR